jgi:hypothetical protein
MRIAFAAVVLVAFRAFGGQLAPEDRDALEHYQLTETNIEKVMRVNDRLAAEARRDPSFVKNLGNDSRGDKTLADSIARLGSNATVARVLSNEDLSPRDFVLTNVAGMQAQMVASVEQTSGAVAAEPIEGVNRANVQFVESHPDLIKRWRESTAATARQARAE